MIEGLKVTIPGSELRDLCNKRATYHAKRAAGYREQLPALDALEAANKSVRACDEARDKIKEHDAFAAEMQFIAEHLDVAETFMLERNDLMRLGVTYSGGRW